jgi:hypothetical protein
VVAAAARIRKECLNQRDARRAVIAGLRLIGPKTKRARKMHHG